MKRIYTKNQIEHINHQKKHKMEIKKKMNGSDLSKALDKRILADQ